MFDCSSVENSYGRGLGMLIGLEYFVECVYKGTYRYHDINLVLSTLYCDFTTKYCIFNVLYLNIFR